jgi:2-polyprenylphenol 6-hydroxylase
MSAARAPTYDAIVVGGGIVGCVIAALLIRQGLCARGRVALVAERFTAAPLPNLDWDLRVFALSRASERLLKLADVWQRMPADRLHPYARMCVWDAAGRAQEQGSLLFDCAEIGEPNLGWIADGAVLQGQSLASAAAAGAVLVESAVESLASESGRHTLKLQDGRELCAAIVIGADGTESKVRQLLNIGTAGHSYVQDALVAHVRTERPHADTAWQRFLPQGPLAFLPLSDGRCSIVWSTSPEAAQQLQAMQPEAFGAAVTQASAQALGGCQLTSALVRFPLKLQYAIEYVRAGAVLLGDAAHVVHPLAGQGLNLGLLDAAALIQVLCDSGGVAEFGDLRILRRYERWRRSENLIAAAGLDGLERLFADERAITSGLRRWGLDTLGQVPLVKRRLARQALGLSGDVPAILRNAAPL